MRLNHLKMSLNYSKKNILMIKIILNNFAMVIVVKIEYLILIIKVVCHHFTSKRKYKLV